jgi:hypothetical protein
MMKRRFKFEITFAGALTPNQKKKCRAPLEKIVKALEEKGARVFRAYFQDEDEDLLDVTPIARSITNIRDPGRFLAICEEIAARPDHTESERARLRKLRRSYEKSCGISLHTTRKGRAAVSFLEEYDERSSVAPIVQALKENDSEFFENVATAMRFRESSRRKTAIAQARRARRAITAAAILQGTKASKTWREARDAFWPEHNGDPKNFQRMLDQCGFNYKRGKIGRPSGKNGYGKLQTGGLSDDT